MQLVKPLSVLLESIIEDPVYEDSLYLYKHSSPESQIITTPQISSYQRHTRQ
jgi:hypothetical protein